MNRILQFSRSQWYWSLLLCVTLTLELVAMFYQYVLDEPPCVLCIHIRVVIAGIMLLSILALMMRRPHWIRLTFHLLNSLLMMVFVERSWQTLAVERGWIFSDCNMESGLPSWLALDVWVPLVFSVQAACGYTPLIIWQISMAEMLMVISSGLLLISLLTLLAQYCATEHEHHKH